MRTREAAAVVLTLIAAACGSQDREPAVPEDSAPPPAPPRESPIRMEPHQGLPGSEVTLEMGGLVMNARDLEIGFGDFAGHEIIDHTDGDAEGRVSTTVTVPATARPGTYYFFIAEANGYPLAVSDSFVVIRAP